MKHSWYIWLIGLLVLVLAAGCSARDPIFIGVAVELSGSRGKIGVTLRNGAQLAVDEINAAGGINGRQIQLIVRDDQGSPEVANQVDQELIDMGVVAIIGHVTSQQTEAVYSLVDRSGVILFSPTSSSPFFSGIEDNFFRVMPDNKAFGQSLGWVISNKYNIQQVISILDIKNQSFVESLWAETRSAFESGGGEVLRELRYNSDSADLKALMEEAAAVNPEAIVFVASDTDTALMAQYGRLLGLDTQYFSSTWAQTEELISKGGSSVEGMVLSAVFDPNSQDPVYLEFCEAYREKFQTEPGLGASHAYEAVMVLAEGLRQTRGELDGLAEALSGIQNYQGVQGAISFNLFGDVLRKSYFVMVEDREFITVDIVGTEDLELP
jgi:branched-chain amino acid transport system substrate-binding protein